MLGFVVSAHISGKKRRCEKITGKSFAINISNPPTLGSSGWIIGVG